MKNHNNTNSSRRFTTGTPQRENEQTTRSFTMRNMGRGLLLGLSLGIAAFSVANAQTGSLQGRRVILNDGGLTDPTFNRIQLNTPPDGSLTSDYSLILPQNNGAVDNILFVQSVSGPSSTLNFTSGDHIFWKLKGNNTTFVDGTNNLLGTLTNDPLNIITNNTTRIRITNAGNVGVNAGNAPSQLFAVGGGAGGNLTIDNSGNLVTAGNLTINGTGTNTIGVAATTNTVLGTTGITGNTLVNNSGVFTTGIGTGTNSGLVTIGNNANGGGITMSAGTSNIVMNNVTIATPAPTDYALWSTGVGNNVRRQLLSGSADQGLMYEAGQYRLGNSTDGNTPIVSSRFVRVGAAGTLTFNTATTTALVINNGGQVDINNVGGANTNIGTSGSGTVAIAGGTINETAGTINVNTSGTGTTNIGALANTGTVNIRANNTITLDVNATTNNLVLNNINTGLNSNDVLLINGTNQVRRLASNQFAWLITGNGHVVTDNVNNLLGTTTAADLRVITNNVTRVVVDGDGAGLAAGNVGIGMTSDGTYRLAVAPNLGAPNGSGILVTGAPVTGLRIEDPSGTGISVGAVTAPTTGMVLNGGTTGLNIGVNTAPSTDGIIVKTAGGANGVRIDQGAAADLVINESSISRTNADIAINPGASNLVTTNGNVTISGANTNTIGVAATTNNVLGATNINNNVNANTQINTGTSTGTVSIGNGAAGAVSLTSGANITALAPNVNLNNSGTGATTIGSTTTGGVVNIRSSGTNAITIDVSATTNNLVLKNIQNLNPIQDLLWIDASDNVRRATFTSTADEGIQFNNSAYRLGHLTNGSAPIVNPRFVRVGAAGTLTFNTATTTSLIINNGGQVDLNTVGGANTNIGSATTGTVAITGATINENAANVNINTLGAGNATTIGNATGNFSIVSNQLNVATSGDISDAGGNVIVADNLDVTGTGTNNIGVAAATNLILGSTTATGTAIVNNTGAFTTSIGTGTNTGLVTIGNNANGGGITMSAGTTNIVLNNVTSATPGASDDVLWITNVGNNVRRTGFSGLANEGLQYQNSAFRLGSNAVDVNPITSARIVTVGAAGTLTFSTAAGANTMLTLNNTGVVGLNTAGGANTNIGSATTGTVAITGATINENAANVNINTLGAGNATTIGNATGNFSIVSNQLNIATSGDISDAGGNVIVADNLDVTGTGTNNIGVAATTNLILGSTTATGTAIVNNTGAFTTSIGTGTNTGLVSIGNGTGGGITMDAGASNIVMNNVTIATPAPTDYSVWMTAAGNNVRRVLLSGTADQGVMYEAGQYRLGNSTNGNTPIVSSRFVRVGAAGTLTFNSAAATMLTLNNNGNVDVSTAGTGVTTIGNATGGNVSVLSGGTIAVTGTTNINTAGTAATSIGNATGAFTLTSNELNVNGTNGELSDANGAVTVNDAQGFVVNSGGAADLSINETTISRAGAITVDPGANLLTLGNAGGTVLLNGTAGTANITATSLSTNVAPTFSHPTDGIVVANGSGVLRRRPVTDLINASNGVIYNETGTDAEVRLGTLAAGTGALTNALAGQRYVNLGTAGILSFNRGAGTNNMLNLNGATGVITMDGSTVNINNNAGNNTTIGNSTGTFGLASTQLNVASASGELSDLVGAVTVNDAEGLVVNTGVAADLTITETTISRVNADININPGGGNIVNTDGSMYVARNLVVDGTTDLGNGSGADNTNIKAGTGIITLTGTTNINTTGSATTTIGAITNTGSVDIAGQSSVSLSTSGTGNVNLQTSGNGDVVIGNTPSANDLTINSNIRGAGPNKFADRVLVNGTGVAAYTIANALATANSVIIVTLESYTGGGILSYQITNRAATSFTITFSNNILVGETVAVHYMIINP